MCMLRDGSMSNTVIDLQSYPSKGHYHRTMAYIYIRTERSI